LESVPLPWPDKTKRRRSSAMIQVKYGNPQPRSDAWKAAYAGG
jgi:hypothetical protein